ncbi:MAG: non-canonical purine NTP pyrophosphatase, partial [Pseudomonadota bacterium]
MRVVLASHNSGKLKELRALLTDVGWQLESQADHQVAAVPEDGLTFVENALLKARGVCAATRLPAIADDSGLVVPALNGAPGIYSARYAGQHGDDHANNQKLLKALTGVQDRRAYFFCAMVFLLNADDPTPIIATAAWHGSILEAPRG